MLVQFPKPSSSILATMACTLLAASGLPCGKSAIWETFAETNNMAEAFLQAATQAPQPMQEAESMASSALCFGIGIALASGTPPVVAEMYPPSWIILSKAVLSTTKSLMIGKGLALHGSITMVSPSLNLLM